jgi:uncharacterized SAM-binding protein YcdF (DUF218 family)
VIDVRHAGIAIVKLSRAVAAALGLFLLFMCTPLSYYFGKPLLEPACPRPSDVIVLLSSGHIEGSWLTPDGMQRTAGALMLYRQGIAPLIISSGSTSASEDQAGVQAKWLALARVPEDCIIVEHRSTRTYESAVEVARIMQERRLTTAVIVTSEFDVPRVRLVFRKLGISPTFLAVPEFNTPTRLFYLGYGPFWHATYEYAALALYKWKGWI